ncbi:MAG: acyl-CoA dehydrogenase family protein, partial [Janthinobacterium lividum]
MADAGHHANQTPAMPVARPALPAGAETGAAPPAHPPPTHAPPTGAGAPAPADPLNRAGVNQPADLRDYNLYATDLVLQQGLVREGAGWHGAHLAALGAELGSAEVLELGELANTHAPALQTHDRIGRRIDLVQFHPAWHALLSLLRREGSHALPWQAARRAGAQVARAAACYLHGQVEAGSLCPATMTCAGIALLQKDTALFADLQRGLMSRQHDPRDVPLAQKTAIWLGMGMTEKQGGSDLRSNASLATPIDGTGRGATYALDGHKWFFSAPMSDAHLVLAQTAEGLSCFFLPRWRSDGSRNTVHIQRLKDKLGNRSNASAEVEFHQAQAVLVGEPGRGIATMIEMANHTRLDCIIGSAALMRQALVQAIHHARHRHVFGCRLCDQALMQNVLADLALESEAAALLMLRLPRAFDASGAGDADQSALEAAWRRIVTPAAKFWLCKRTVAFTGECLEVWGGNGYVETGPMARLYREAPVNSIWEGSANVMCLDVLRAAQREPRGMTLLL